MVQRVLTNLNVSQQNHRLQAISLSHNIHKHTIKMSSSNASNTRAQIL